jgi:PPK2 family polyphosphate:nucleotide phosphotransferase
VAKKPGARLADFQYASARPGAPSGKRARRVDLAAIDPHAKPFSSGDKAADQAAVAALADDIDRLQDMLFADRRFKMLVVLQGTDTSGKDGTIRGVFAKTSALGVRTAAWKAPSEEERAHDFLWRIHQKVPAAGEIVIFNRSHYEDVLVPVVKGWLKPEETAQRFAQINDFERLLVESGTVVLKFLLHISKEEQRERLQDRLDDPAKHWKFAVGDLEERTRWDAYQAAYGEAVSATGTPWAPWTIVPADSKTHRNLMIATVVKQSLEAMNLRYPPGDPALANIKVI